jgi:hypothetical protein
LGWLIFLLLLLSGCIAVQAGPGFEDKKPVKPAFDSLYIRSFPNHIAIRLIREVQVAAINYQIKGLGELNFSSNHPANTGIGLDYRWLSLEYTRSFSARGPDPLRGNSRMQGAGVAASTRRLWFKAFFRDNTGFYLQNTDQVLPGYRSRNDRRFFLRPDLRATTFFATLNYCFNHRRFSNSANLYQLEQQLKPAGSPVAGISVGRNGYMADSVLLPAASIWKPAGDRQTVALSVFSVGINAGYVYNFPFGKKRRWFVNTGLIPGIAFQSGSRRLAGGEENYFRTTGLHTEFRLSSGFNHPRWFASFGFRYFSVFNDADKTNPVSVAYSLGHLAAGYRFAAPKKRPLFFRKLGL